MTILIDDRAGSKELINYPPLNKVGELTRLDSGDVAISGNGPEGPVLVGIEVKKLTELLQAMSTGRLQATQVVRMKRDFDVCWLCFTGVYRAGPKGVLQARLGKSWVSYTVGGMRQGTSHIPWGYLEKFLMTLSAAGVQHKHFYDTKTMALWIGAMAEWWEKPWDKHESLKKFDNSGAALLPGLDTRTDLIARMVAQIDDLGYKRAVEVAQHFPGVEAMLNADEKDWQRVRGVGKTIAKSVAKTWEMIR